MSQPMIILYDVPSTSSRPWAPNVWRIRLILNYKRLPYRTYWVEFPDIETTLRTINAPPTSIRPDGRPVYTLPAILDPTHISRSTYLDPSGSLSQARPVVLTNANTIAEYLELTYPARPVIPDGARALQTLFVHYVTEIFIRPLLQVMIPLSHQRLPLHVQSHFPIGAGAMGDHHSISEDGHGPGQGSSGTIPAVETAAQQARRQEELWMAIQMQFSFLAGILQKNAGDGDGVVAMGHELTYADFTICSVLIWIEKIAPHDGWVRVREWDNGRWRRLWERCRQYMDVF